MFTNQKPEAVFTPRAADVNPAMYIDRPKLEQELSRGLRGNLHLVLHGDSGTGKSWLYKSSFAKQKVSYVVANLANASRLKSISAELTNIVNREGKPIKVGYDESKSASITAALASGELSHLGKYEIGQMEPFESCLAALRASAGSRHAVLVFDNLEAAFTEPLLKELADLIILCDDTRYAKYGVKILIVGVPSGIKEYYYKTPHHTTVSNRLTELPEVSRLTPNECSDLVYRGLIDLLKYSVYDIDAFSKHVAWITDRIPQMVHEYCLEVAFIAEDSRRVEENMVREADNAWISKSLTHAYAVVESHMNERDTKAGRRNQTLFSLSLCHTEQFKAPEIETILRDEFPSSTANTALNVPQMLSQLAKTDRPLIKRSPKGDAYSFADPKYRMVLRSMLRKTSDERVEKVLPSVS